MTGGNAVREVGEGCDDETCRPGTDVPVPVELKIARIFRYRRRGF